MLSQRWKRCVDGGKWGTKVGEGCDITLTKLFADLELLFRLALL